MDHQCSECKIRFSKHSNLRTHVKKFHGERLEEIAPNKARTCKAVCNECSQTFSKYSNLKRHVERFHSEKVDQLISPKIYAYQCQYCKKNFSNINHYKNHKKTHNDQSNLDNRLAVRKCSLCHFEMVSKSTLHIHFKEAHDIEVSTKSLNFLNANEFDSWKNNLEKITCSKYVSSHGSYKTQGGVKNILYVCHRSGFYVKKGKGLRHLKTQGSNKINGICPSEILVKIQDNGTYDVIFIETHIGHDNELGHLNLTDSQRMDLACKIASNVPFTSILDDIRDSVTGNSLERIHLLSRKDLHNITQLFNLNNESVRHKDDAISIEAWVNQVKESGTILFYKPQGEKCERYPFLNDDDFVIIIMHPGQLEILNKFCDDCICIDGTHGLNDYDFELTTLLVLDDMREGFPCSFMFSNRTDEVVMQIFFKEIKDNLGRSIQARVFMSDMAPAYYNAWLQVFDPAKFRLFCTWHVDRAWRKNLNKIDGQESQANVYKQLRTLLQERDPEAFLTMLQNFVNELLSTSQTLEFGRYFVQNYVDNVNAWAYCHRLHAGINTNMHIERMHHTIKYLYLEGKKAHRLDKTINKIMKFIKDKLFERLIIINKGKISTKIKDLRSKHKTSEKLDTSTVIQTESDECNVEKKIEQEQLVQILSKSDVNLRLNKKEDQLNVEKEKLKTLHIQLIDKISTFEELETFKRVTASIGPTLAAVRKNNEQEIRLPPTVPHVPHNKRIDRQRFFSTKKKNKRTAKMRKPNDEEANTAAIRLLKCNVLQQ